MAKGSIEISIRDIPEVKAELKRYEKALDKVCEHLEMIEENLTLDSSYHSKELWKEWALGEKND